MVAFWIIRCRGNYRRLKILGFFCRVNDSGFAKCDITCRIFRYLIFLHFHKGIKKYQILRFYLLRTVPVWGGVCQLLWIWSVWCVTRCWNFPTFRPSFSCSMFTPPPVVVLYTGQAFTYGPGVPSYKVKILCDVIIDFETDLSTRYLRPSGWELVDRNNRYQITNFCHRRRAVWSHQIKCLIDWLYSGFLHQLHWGCEDLNMAVTT